MIVDTDVIIWDLRGNARASKTLRGSAPFSISVVTYIELIKGMRNKTELQTLRRQFDNWSVNIIQINNDISVRAMLYLEEFFLSHSMEMADALIAATAVNAGQEILTANDKHYRHIPNLHIKKFHPN